MSSRKDIKKALASEGVQVMPDVEDVIAFDEGTMTEEQEIEYMQGLIDSGMAWKLQGSVGREAMRMIEAGLCVLGEKGHKDYWGNYVPSKHEVKAGTKGSEEYCDRMWGV